MSALDCNTPRGRESIERARRAAQLFVNARPGRRIVHTPEDSRAELDGVLLLSEKMVATVEIKDRDFTVDAFCNRFNMEWLLSASKLQAGKDAARLFGVRLLGLLYFRPDDAVLVVPLVNHKGDIECSVRYEDSVTQATCNGGTAMRRNAYIFCGGLTLIREPNIVPVATPRG